MPILYLLTDFDTEDKIALNWHAKEEGFDPIFTFIDCKSLIFCKRKKSIRGILK